MELISFIIVLFLSFFCIWRFDHRLNLSKRDLTIGWGIKLGFSFSFILVFTQFYGNGNLYGDANNFVHDSGVLCEFAKLHPWEYVKLLFGFANETALFDHTILSDTNIWSYGENGDFINDNRLIIRINSIIHFFSFGNIYTHALIMCLLSYAGVVLTYKAFSDFVLNKKLFFYTLVAFPSVAFWSSGITKEALLFLAMGLFFYGLMRLLKKFSFFHLTIMIVGVFMLLFNKPHVGLIVVTLMPFLLCGHFFNWTRNLLFIFPIAVIIGIIGLTYTPSSINLLDKVSYKQKDLINMGKGGIFFVTDSSFCAFDYQYLDHFEAIAHQKIRALKNTPGEYKLFGQHNFYPFNIHPSQAQYDIYLIQPPSLSYVPVTPIRYNRDALFKMIPEVLHNTIIRPYPWDPGSELKYFPFASNLLLIAFALFVFMNRKKTNFKEKYFLLYFVISALLILMLIGWTTPILGAIVRYKTAAEFLFLIGLSLSLKSLKNEV